MPEHKARTARNIMQALFIITFFSYKESYVTLYTSWEIDMMKSYTCIVEGKVTGGNFQSWVLDAAQLLGLKGWVRNIENGKAEILLQGDAQAYATFRERLNAEAPVPDLKNITCTVIDYDKVHEHFEVRG